MQTSKLQILQEEAAQKTSQDSELMESDLHQLADNHTVRRDDEGQLGYTIGGCQERLLKLKNPPKWPRFWGTSAKKESQDPPRLASGKVG